MNALVKAELDNLQLQFPSQSQINLDQYAELYKIKRRWASIHLKKRNIPATKEGRSLYISIMDLATYKARHKTGGDTLILRSTNQADEMKRRRGFNQMAERKLLGK